MIEAVNLHKVFAHSRPCATSLLDQCRRGGRAPSPNGAGKTTTVRMLGAILADQRLRQRRRPRYRRAGTRGAPRRPPARPNSRLMCGVRGRVRALLWRAQDGRDALRVAQQRPALAVRPGEARDKRLDSFSKGISKKSP